MIELFIFYIISFSLFASAYVIGFNNSRIKMSIQTLEQKMKILYKLDTDVEKTKKIVQIPKEKISVKEIIEYTKTESKIITTLDILDKIK